MGEVVRGGDKIRKRVRRVTIAQHAFSLTEELSTGSTGRSREIASEARDFDRALQVSH